MDNCFVTTKLYARLQTQVHVWFCNPLLIGNEAKLSEYKAILSKQETEQYHRFLHEKDRHSYLVSHALLRISLSKYVNVPASQWQFISGRHGKPELLSSSALPELCFNLTHTGGLSGCVISLHRRCGIDAENIHRKNKLNAVAQRMFAEQELAQLDEKNIASRFYYLWTLREAYVKALGLGLSGSSKEFYFDIDMDDLSVVLHHNNDHQIDAKNRDVKNWRFNLCTPTSDHVLAVGFESSHAMQVLMTELIP